MKIFKSFLSLPVSCAVLIILHNIGMLILETDFVYNISHSAVISGALPVVRFIYFSIVLFIALNLGIFAIYLMGDEVLVMRIYGIFSCVFLIMKAIGIYKINGMMLSVLIPYLFFVIMSIGVIFVRKNTLKNPKW